MALTEELSGRLWWFRLGQRLPNRSRRRVGATPLAVLMADTLLKLMEPEVRDRYGGETVRHGRDGSFELQHFKAASKSRSLIRSVRENLRVVYSTDIFVSHLKRGKKSINQLEDVHRLRLLYNRYLQWRFANAQSEAASHIQKVIAEETLYNVWWENHELWDSVITKRTNLQQLQLELDLNVVLNEQVAYLEDWASLEREHSASLAGVINDLESSTLRLPITDGARADVVSLKAAISSVVDMMYAMASSIHSVLSKVLGNLLIPYTIDPTQLIQVYLGAKNITKNVAIISVRLEICY